MYEAYTFDYLMADVLKHAPEGIDTRQGSIFYDANAAVCLKIAKLYTDLDTIAEMTTIATATGEALDAKAAEKAVYRLAATRAKYLVSFEGVTPDVGERFYYYNREASIGTICPSVLVSGGSNFPVRKKKKQIAAWDRNHQFYADTQALLDKLQGILNGKGIIKSDDEKAVEKLEEKLEDMRALQEKMKAVNRAIRLKDTEAGDDELRGMGYSEEEIKELRKPDFCGRVGFPDYALANNNANIRRVEGRIKELKAVKERGSSEQEYKTFKVVENTEAMRYQIIFDGKPEPEVRDILKANGFRWAPSQGAWQRQITANGKYALKTVLEKLQEIGVQ